MCLGPELIAAIQVIGTVTAAAGTGYSIVQGQEAAGASKKAEDLRKQQMQLESQQKQRAKIREFQLARANSASNSVSSTGTLENSAYQGASSAYGSSTGTNLADIGEAQSIGNQLFSANAEYSQASANAQAGGQISQFGKDLFASGPAIGRIGSTLFSNEGTA